MNKIINHNYKIKLLHKKYKSILIFFKLFCFFFILILKKYENYFLLFSKSILNINQTIIETQTYEKFQNIKDRFNNDSFLNNYLQEIRILSHIYNKKSKKIKKHKKNIHICMCLNNKYLYPVLVSMESVLTNCNKKKTFIIYHILCSPNLTQISLKKLKSLIISYGFNLEIIFYNMGNNFMNLYHNRISQAAYYRLLTPIIIDVDRIIYLDGDTLILKDLNEMYEVKLNDNYVLGNLDFQSNGIDYLGIKSKKYINSGVLLLNLEKIRNNNKFIHLLNITINNTKLIHQDQTIINFILYPKIGILPSKYSIWNFNDKLDIMKYSKHLRIEININEFEMSLNDPTIIHNVLCWPKLWFSNTKYDEGLTACKKRNNCNCKKYSDLWHFYARKTNYYNEILYFSRKKKNFI